MSTVIPCWSLFRINILLWQIGSKPPKRYFPFNKYQRYLEYTQLIQKKNLEYVAL